jgi:hypothetical protein
MHVNMHLTLVDSEAPTFHFGKKAMNKLTVYQRSSRNASARLAHAKKDRPKPKREANPHVRFRRGRARGAGAMRSDVSMRCCAKKCVVTTITFPAAKAWRRHDGVTVTG